MDKHTFTVGLMYCKYILGLVSIVCRQKENQPKKATIMEDDIEKLLNNETKLIYISIQVCDTENRRKFQKCEGATMQQIITFCFNALFYS